MSIKCVHGYYCNCSHCGSDINTPDLLIEIKKDEDKDKVYYLCMTCAYKIVELLE